MSEAAHGFVVRALGRVPYAPIWQAMREFTDRRTAETPDELWLLEHEPVYTLGLAGDLKHLINPTDTPVVKTDRGGQITWHGPGQLVVYVLCDLRRLNLGPREMVRKIEAALIESLTGLGITAARRPGAPGVYVEDAKIASLGLRIRNGCSYHGLALNVSCELAPFSCINPCGYAGLAVTSLAALGLRTELGSIAESLTGALARGFHPLAAAPIIPTAPTIHRMTPP